MRQFVYFSSKAATSGNFNPAEAMKSGRLDIAFHVVISAFFLSHDFRRDARLHLVFYGAPDPPKHIELQVSPELPISKKDVGNLIRKMLYKYRKGQKTEVFPNCFIEKKSFLDVIEELKEQGSEIYVLEKKGKDIRDLKIGENCVFVLGDHEGFPPKELKRLKKIGIPVSVGNRMYFASHVVSVVNNELDRRGI